MPIIPPNKRQPLTWGLSRNAFPSTFSRGWNTVPMQDHVCVYIYIGVNLQNRYSFHLNRNDHRFVGAKSRDRNQLYSSTIDYVINHPRPSSSSSNSQKMIFLFSFSKKKKKRNKKIFWKSELFLSGVSNKWCFCVWVKIELWILGK